MNKYRKDMQRFEKAFEKIISDVSLKECFNWDWDNSFFKIQEAYEEKIDKELINAALIKRNIVI